jgi:demethylmenaquinone methyltransferase/2-methoxy-6-polyprenyl-1,4-benzoquinol methylase
MSVSLKPSAAEPPAALPEPQVRAMFDRIAGIYDLLNTVMTAGLHHHWRERAVALSGARPGDRVLDVATGTGDLALALAQAVAPGGSVVAADFSERMLEVARAKAAARRPPASVELRCANALALPFAAGEFAAATVGFGVRNFADLERGLAELARVVRPGGRVVVLEITMPRRQPLAGLLRLWFEHAVPLLGRIAGERSAYSYLPRSVARFPPPERLAELMWRVGLRRIRWVQTGGGIVAIHIGEVPPASEAPR